MAGQPEKPKCNSCRHECHCDTLVCIKLIGVGLSDKSQPCDCGVCNCAPEAYS